MNQIYIEEILVMTDYLMHTGIHQCKKSTPVLFLYHNLILKGLLNDSI